MNENRIAFVDYLRVVACFMVMLVHASENFYGADWSGMAANVSMLANESNRFWVAFYDGFASRACVPLFMIASAFLLVPLKPGTTMTQFYRRRFVRILPPFVFFLVLYCLLPLAWGGMTWQQSLTDLRNLPWNFPSMAGHLWFMYPLISLYIIMPVVSPWLERATAREERMFLAFFLLSTFIPFIHRFVTPEVWGECFWNQFSALWYCSGFLGYLVLAHYIRQHLTWNRRRRLILGSVCALLGAAFTGWSFWFKGVPGQIIDTPMLEWAWEFCTPNLVLMTFGLFVLFTTIRPHRVPRLVTDISKRSFGMYLTHMLFLSVIAGYVVNGNPANPLLPVYLAIPVIAIGTYVCSYLTIKLISLIPGGKWLVG